ncbi:MAG: peptidoglycan-binding protein [Rhodobacteraceae bacterium]|nr:peptidoglycan-binding protein [Paracoccaceae bacterium]
MIWVASQLRIVLALCLFLPVMACTDRLTQLAPDIAQPKTRPARNFTSFDEALRCMDVLLGQTRRPTVKLSSTGIADHTRRINVAGDDMLINALVRMTRTSHAYVFLDQGLVSAQGLIDLLVVQKKNTPRPDYYVRGAISQLDSNVAVNDVDVDIDDLKNPTGPGVNSGAIDNKDELSVVSVDLHLVGYPSRRVVHGASVSNSLVVHENGWGFGTSGIIALTGVDVSVKIDRIESTGQAVRNLIEVSLIELIGRHANVPYWQCLSGRHTNAKTNSDAERSFVDLSVGQRVRMAQEAMRKLNRLDEAATGELTENTRRALARFQSDENLLVNGIVDFDTFHRLHVRVQTGNALPVSAPLSRLERRQSTQANTANSATSQTNDTSLRELLPADRQRTERRDRSGEAFSPLGSFLN